MSWTGRTTTTSAWGKIRLGGAYLKNSLGEYILTNDGKRIIVIVPGGELSIANWGSRILTSSSWAGRIIPN